MHHITISSAVNMVDISLSGTLTQDDVDAVAVKLRSAFALEKLKSGYLVLGDIAHCSIQSQAIMAELAALIGKMPPAKRIAIITGSAMVNLQLGRVISRPYLRTVADRQAALAWLVRGEEPAIAA